MKRIIVVGSSNTDLVVKTDKIPDPGETVIGTDFTMSSGGKGANQAVAAFRLGGNISFITKLADDTFGNRIYDEFREENMDMRFIFKDSDKPTGVALICVNRMGDNIITVAPGANETLSCANIDLAAENISEADYLLLQLEIPVSIVEYIVNIAHQNKTKVILNPAPASILSKELLSKLYLITPNETEAKFLTGIDISNLDEADKAAQILLDKGVENVVITLGAKGAYVKNSTCAYWVEAISVEAVDTTAAGDVFNGALAVALSEDKDLLSAVEFATKASAISVTRNGARDSIPYRYEIK